MTEKNMLWNRKLWAIKFGSKNNSFIIGQAWHEDYGRSPCLYTGEPTRAMVFNTKKQAKTCCDEINKKWATKLGGKCRVIRVTEVVVEVV